MLLSAVSAERQLSLRLEITWVSLSCLCAFHRRHRRVHIIGFIVGIPLQTFYCRILIVGFQFQTFGGIPFKFALLLTRLFTGVVTRVLTGVLTKVLSIVLTIVLTNSIHNAIHSTIRYPIVPLRGNRSINQRLTFPPRRSSTARSTISDHRLTGKRHPLN